MVDIVDRATRSRMMSGIRSSNTKPEVLTRKALHKLGYRFRLASKAGKIKPDIILRSRKVAIFVHGCFWHQHPGCNHAYADRERSSKWRQKFSDNQARDHRVTEQLLELDWRVAVIWECATRDKSIFRSVIDELHFWIQSGNGQYWESSFKKTSNKKA